MSYGPSNPRSTVDRPPLPAVELTGARPTAALELSDDGQEAGEGKWSTGNSIGRSPEVGRRRGGQMTVVKWWRGGSSMEATLELGEERKVGVARVE
jgi:hypothetical protein